MEKQFYCNTLYKIFHPCNTGITIIKNNLQPADNKSAEKLFIHLQRYFCKNQEVFYER